MECRGDDRDEGDALGPAYEVGPVLVATAAVLVSVVFTLVQRDASTQTIASADQSGIAANTVNVNQPVGPAPRHLTDETIAQLKTVARDAVVVVATAGDTRETANYANEITACCSRTTMSTCNAARR